MSHHLDTPLARQNGQLYIDDLYVFRGTRQPPCSSMDVNSDGHRAGHARPASSHEARYEFKIHFDGADFETLTYRVSFGAAGRRGPARPLRLHALTGERRAQRLGRR